MKHKPLFHRNYLEQYVPGIFIPPDLLMSAFPSWSKVPGRLGKLALGLRTFLNTKYANFVLASSLFRTSRVRLESVRLYATRGRNDASPVILQRAVYLITSVSLPRLLQSSSLYLLMKYIKHHCLFSFLNGSRNVVQGTYID